MKAPTGKEKIYLKPGATDLRKGANGLAVIVEEEMDGKVLSGSIYLFCNKERTLLKVLWWDKTGFWLSQKRLEKAKWPWPKSKQKAREITQEQLDLVLVGIEISGVPIKSLRTSLSGRKKRFLSKSNVH